MAKNIKETVKKIKNYWNEEWVLFAQELPTVANDYYISNYGRVKGVLRRTQNEKLLKGSKVTRGYSVVGISYSGGTAKTFYIHHLVAENFCEKTTDANETYVIHIDGNMNNNHFLNLKYVNREELNEHLKKIGVWDPQKKKRNSAYKMSQTKVKRLKTELKDEANDKNALAKKYKISRKQVAKIEKGIAWGWVTLDDTKE